MSDQGHIQVIYGPMFSGKSSELLRKVRRYQHAKKRCLVINYLQDNRFSNDEVMTTHDRQTIKSIKTANLQQLKQKAYQYHVIAIDEGQFFNNIVDFCEDLANAGKIVIVAALDGTFQRKSFGNIINLLPIAQKVTKLTSICVHCGNQAAFTQRIIASEQIELIGGEQSYQPVCRRCFMNTKNGSSNHLVENSRNNIQINGTLSKLNNLNLEKGKKPVSFTH